MSWKRACALILFCVAPAIVSPAQTLTTLVSFDGTNGALPFYSGSGSLVQTTNGDLYGTAYGSTTFYGTIFKITRDGALTTLHRFDFTDGAYPEDGLVQATNGDLYGTTVYGGNDTCSGGGGGCGTIFKISPAGVFTTLHSFDSTDGAYPYAGLIQAANGDLYGTTEQGGGNGNGLGTIFKITPGGVFTTLHRFDGTDGAYPDAGLVQATNGYLYGTTVGGGDGGVYGAGTIFRITSEGVLTTLHSFTNRPDPGYGSLVRASNGDFYGTTKRGGAYNIGEIFKITPDGALTVVHSFGLAHGYFPEAGLVQATDGNLYGTAYEGGANGYGTIFEINPAGALTVLHSFAGTDGNGPNGLVQATDGDLYGTTVTGGAHDAGTIFKLSVGLGPFVKTLPADGVPGSVVKILGTDLTGATSVTFNGIEAAFTVVSTSEISTTVPTGATTGKVQVITPSGTLVSNVGFVVELSACEFTTEIPIPLKVLPDDNDPQRVGSNNRLP